MTPLFRTGVWLILFLCSGYACPQLWSGILEPDRAIEWAGSGVGRIPERTQICATLTAPATTLQINAALARCGPDQAVFLEAGTYAIDGNIVVPSRVTLRGAGAGRTILNATGAMGGSVIKLGGGSVPFRPIQILSGSNRQSTKIQLAPDQPIEPGMFLAIAETNDPAYVSSGGSEGNCNWCDGGWTKSGSLARG